MQRTLISFEAEALELHVDVVRARREHGQQLGVAGRQLAERRPRRGVEHERRAVADPRLVHRTAERAGVEGVGDDLNHASAPTVRRTTVARSASASPSASSTM